MHALATQSLTWPDKVGLVVTLVSAIGAAVTSCLAAWRSGRVHAAMQPPSNGVNAGSVTENTNVAVRQLGYLLADALKQNLVLPTPLETQELKPGATLTDPPPAPTRTPDAPAQPPIVPPA